MQIIDLSHPITPDMPVYPGTEPPSFTAASSLEKHGFVEKRIAFCSHTGTHVDVPAHMIDGGQSIDQLPVERFWGPAVLLDVRSCQGGPIDVVHLKPYQDFLEKSDFALLHTGSSRFWGAEAYFSGYPVLSPEAARWLGRFKLKGLGVDAISVDEADSVDFPVHRILLSVDRILVENLTNLDRLPPAHFTLACFPLKIKGGDGSPVRAVAIIT